MYYQNRWHKHIKDKSLIPVIEILFKHENEISDGYEFYTGENMVGEDEDEFDIFLNTTIATLEEIASEIKEALQ